MNQKSHSEEALFEAALQFDTEAKRAAYLVRECGSNDKLRQDVMALLRGYEDGSPLDDAIPIEALAEEFAETTESLSEAPGDLIDRYELLEKLGEGGFGSVWAAEQKDPVKRRVALKILKLGMDTNQVVARFEAERQALAMMDHPNIAKVFDAGATETGRPYFVMELVRGISITEYCDQKKLNTRERLDLFINVCHAVQHAHQKGIIHRDLKPSNILVTSQDGEPVPKVIDFGIAKATQEELTDKTVYTKFQQFIGTPAYISPEQAKLNASDIDTRSDIYSLGVLLYELLTGSTPFDSKELLATGLDEMRKIIREKDPVRPSTRLSQLRSGTRENRSEAEIDDVNSDPRQSSEVSRLPLRLATDLDWIVMKCLEKERTRRYDTANGLAEELVRHLNHEAIVARPPSKVYRLQKAWQRNKLLYTASAAIALTLMLGITASVWQATVATHAKAEKEIEAHNAKESALKLQHNLARQHLHLGQALCERGKVAAGLHWMVRAIEAAPSGSEALVRDIENNLTAWRQQWAEPEMVLSHDSNAKTTDFSPDSEHVITGNSEGELTLWSVSSGEELWKREAHHGGIDNVKFSPDGTRILTIAKDGDGTTHLHLWLADSGAPIGRPIEWAGGDVAFSPDGQLLIADVERHMAQILSAQSGQPVSPRLRHSNGYELSLMSVAEANELPKEGASQVIVALVGADLHIRIFDPMGKRAVDKPEAELLGGQALHDLKGLVNEVPLPQESEWSLEKRQEVMAKATSIASPILPDIDYIRNVTFSPDGKLALVANGGFEGTATIWNVDSGNQLGPAFEHGRGIWVAAFGPQSDTIAIGCEDGTIHVWSVKTRARLFPIMRHEKKIWAIAFHPDGDRLLTASEDHTARLWSTENGEPIGDTMRHDSWIKSASFSPDGTRVLTAGGDGTARLWSAESVSPIGPPMRHMEKFVMGASFSPKGDRILTLTDGPVRSLWNVQQASPKAHRTGRGFGNVTAKFSPDGRLVASGLRWANGPVRINDAATRERLGERILHKSGVWTLAFSPLGRQLVTGGDDGMLRFWDVASRQPLEIPPLEHEETVRDVAYSADGKIIATASRAARLWSATDGSPLSPPLIHPESVREVALSRDGEILVTACRDGSTRVWSVKSAQEILPPLGQGGSVDISQDRGLIATGDGMLVKFWDLKNGQQTSMVLAHDGPVNDVTFSADGRWLLTASDDGTVRLWSVDTGEQIGPNLLPVSDPIPFECVFSPDGKQVVIADHTYGTWIVDLPDPLDRPHPDPRLWIEVITRQEMDEHGTLTWVEPDDWLAKRKQLAALKEPFGPK